MDERKRRNRDPWEPGMYETGRTRPPKNHGGLIALLLVVVIFLCGVVSVLGFMNVRLFAQLNQLPKENEDPLSFINQDGTEYPQIIDYTEPAESIPDSFSGNLPDSLVLRPSPDSVPNVIQEGGISLQEIYDKNIASVVSISCQSRGASSSGTGVIISASGYIVTNNHVVEGAQVITVLLQDERSFTANLVGADDVTDLAVLQITAEDLTPAEFGDSSVLRVGDSVAAIGNPLGQELRGTLTNGIVSAINRDVTHGGRTLTLIQTNAALNSGNSGGPLINCYGQVIGINTLKIGSFTDSAGVEGLGFAIPSTTVKEIVEQLVIQGYVSDRPTLGILGEGVSNFYQYYYRMPAGIYITEVEETSDAAAKGIEPGDILTAINGVRVTDMDSLKSIILEYSVGDIVTAHIYRRGVEHTVSLVLHESTT